MDYELNEHQQQLRKEYEEFFAVEMKNAPPDYRIASPEAVYVSDEGWEFHLQMRKKLVEKGWLAMAWPKEYGGRDAPIMEQLIFSEVQSYYNAPGIDRFGLHMFAPTLMLFANEEQKKRLLPPIAHGEVNYCQGWSEPNAGSDLASLETTATKDGDEYVVSGQKVWTTGAHRADHMFLLARTNPEEKRGKGLSVFNVDMTLPGIEVRPIHYMNGGHVYNEIFFNNVRIHESERIGPENEGWQSTRATMNFERSGVGTFASMKRSLEQFMVYLKTTKRGGKYLSENPINRQKVARLYADMEAGRSLAYRIAWSQEKGGLMIAPHAASESKVFGTELAQRLANFATEIMGLHGQLEECAWSPLGGAMPLSYQGCMGRNIAAGSSEVQRNIIAWVGVGLPRFK
jgi:alkylation response protein AidB-like acyl-CoA dehydrogenase